MFSDEIYANPDYEIYASLLPGLTTLRCAGAMIVAISTVYRRPGLLYEKWLKHHGRDDPHVLAIRQPGEVYNPLLESDRLLKAENNEQRTADPQRAAADWDSIWRADLADFVDRAAVEACIKRERYELPPVPGVGYYAFTDTSGSGADAMTLAIAHLDRATHRAVLDLVREIRPLFSTEAAVAEFAGAIKPYSCSQVCGDRYGGEWPREAFRRHGIRYVVSEASKSQLYVELLPFINGGRIELLDHPRLVNQLPRLEHRTGYGTGRDNIDHPRGDHDDLVNAAAGALVGAMAKKGPMVIDPSVVARSAQMRSAGANPWAPRRDVPTPQPDASVELFMLQQRAVRRGMS